MNNPQTWWAATVTALGVLFSTYSLVPSLVELVEKLKVTSPFLRLVLDFLLHPVATVALLVAGILLLLRTRQAAPAPVSPVASSGPQMSNSNTFAPTINNNVSVPTSMRLKFEKRQELMYSLPDGAPPEFEHENKIIELGGAGQLLMLHAGKDRVTTVLSRKPIFTAGRLVPGVKYESPHGTMEIAPGVVFDGMAVTSDAVKPYVFDMDKLSEHTITIDDRVFIVRLERLENTARSSREKRYRYTFGVYEQ